MTDLIEDDGFITVLPDLNAAATHAPGVATTEALISARAVVADLPHYDDAEVKAACEAIIAHSDRDVERKEAAILLAFIKKEN
jgi:hypothetical protein